MPEDSPGNTPKPGHFLPGGSGDVLTDGDSAAAQPLTAGRRQALGLGKARQVTTADSSLRRVARPLPADPNASGEYSGPPVAPLTGAPLTPLTGTRRAGGRRPVGWHSNPSRTGAQFSAEPPPIKPPRHYSKAVIAGLSVLVVLMLTAATIVGFKLIDSYGNTYDNPMARPSVKKSEAPLLTPPDPTVTVTVPSVPDLVRLQKNELYRAGTVASVSCKEPAIKPNSQSAILKYYQAVLPCLNKAWAPLVTKAGYDFKPPGLVLQSKRGKTSCDKETDGMFYCDSGVAISINWKQDLANYKVDPLATRMWMLYAISAVYGHHVQNMTQMLTAELSRQGWAKTEAEKLQWMRRRQLQAGCLGAAFLGANKNTLGLTGAKFESWEQQVKQVGEDAKEAREHGSSKNNWLWSSAGFKSADPKSCNTFTAPAAKVS